jgi:hypothetical protein
MPTIVSQKGTGSTSVIERSDFEKEDDLQEFIHEHPELIPVYEIREDKRLLVLAREFATQSGPIDALAVDKDGDIYVVETKLHKNSDKRKVVAQVLDYGASLWKHSSDFESFQIAVNKHVRDKWAVDLSDKAREFFDLTVGRSRSRADAAGHDRDRHKHARDWSCRVEARQHGYDRADQGYPFSH